MRENKWVSEWESERKRKRERESSERVTYIIIITWKKSQLNIKCDREVSELATKPINTAHEAQRSVVNVVSG